MPPDTVFKHNSFIKNYLYPVLIFSLCAAVFFACHKKTAGNTDYTPEFKKAFDNSSRISEKNPEYAAKYLDSAFSKIRNPSFNDRFRRLSVHFVLMVKTRLDPQHGMLYADSMLSLVNQNGGSQVYPSNFAEANFAKGDANFDLKRFNDAYHYYFIGYQTGKKYFDGVALANYSYRLGMIAYKQKHFRLSAQYFKDSYLEDLPLDSDFVNFYRNQEVLDNISLCYSHLQMNDSALYYFDRTIEYIDRKGPHFPAKANMLEIAKAVILGNKADIYIRNKEYTQAIALLKQSIAINMQTGNDNSDGLLSEIKLAQIYEKQKEDSQLIALLNAIRSQLPIIKNKDAEADWNRLMSDYNERHGNLTAALTYTKRYYTIKDSIESGAKSLQESNVTDQLANYQKQHEIEDLINNNKLQRIYLLVAVAYAIMALIIILLVYRNWTRSKLDLNTVNELNKQISKQKLDLEHTLDQLNESSREKDRIMHAVAHDLRNPLGGIASLTNTMMMDDDFTEEQKEYIHIIKETADNSLELINELFEATDAVIDESKKQLIDINGLLTNSIELLRFKAAEKNQRIILRPLDVSVNVSIVREKIWRVLSNLVINAVKFSPPGAEIEVNMEIVDGDVVISVKDHGIGIPELMKPKVFNMFTEAKRPGTIGEKSFGLGLSISQQIIEQHRGRIWFDSVPEKGSTFYISLPLPSAAQKIPIPVA